MDNIFDLIDNDRQLSYLPYGNQRRLIPFLWAGPLLTILSSVGYVYKLIPEWLFIVGAFIGVWLLIQGLFERFIQTRIRLIFDKSDQAIIVKSWTGRKKKMANFGEIGGVLTETHNQGFRYCLTFEGNAFGKNIPVSNYFRVDKTAEARILFEDTVFPLVIEMLDIKLEITVNNMMQ